MSNIHHQYDKQVALETSKDKTILYLMDLLFKANKRTINACTALWGISACGGKTGDLSTIDKIVDYAKKNYDDFMPKESDIDIVLKKYNPSIGIVVDGGAIQHVRSNIAISVNVIDIDEIKAINNSCQKNIDRFKEEQLDGLTPVDFKVCMPEISEII